MIYDQQRCLLGEGPLWHPERGELYWFDILNSSLMWREGDQTRAFRYPTFVAAAGWIDWDRLLISSSTGLHVHDLTTHTEECIAEIELDNPTTRANDGRADPWGGFWHSTMGVEKEEGAGTIYRYYKGEVRPLYPNITIPNAISFAPNEPYAYFTDTPKQIIWRVRLSEKDGWPEGEPEDWIDLRKEDHNPDGAVTDAEGNLWSAQWGSYRVACYAPDGSFVREVKLGAAQCTCPSFGGEDLTTLLCTSAAVGIDEAGLGDYPDTGKTFAVEDVAQGHPEHQVIL
ncbi:MAG: SMP-30/gluconolactonase/LRE family protein [Shimia sp.]